MLATGFGLSGLSGVDRFASGCRHIINDRRKWDMKFDKYEWLSSWNDTGPFVVTRDSAGQTEV